MVIFLFFLSVLDHSEMEIWRKRRQKRELCAVMSIQGEVRSSLNREKEKKKRFRTKKFHWKEILSSQNFLFLFRLLFVKGFSFFSDPIIFLSVFFLKGLRMHTRTCLSILLSVYLFVRPCFCPFVRSFFTG